MDLLRCAVAALLVLLATPAAAQPTPTPRDEMGNRDDLSAEGVEGSVRAWTAAERNGLPRLEDDVQSASALSRQMRDDLSRIRGDAAAQKAVVAVGDIRPNGFARAKRNWNAWKAVVQDRLDKATETKQVIEARKAEQQERWELLDDDSTSTLVRGTAAALQEARAVQDRVMGLLGRLENLAEGQIKDAQAAIAICDEVSALLDRGLQKSRSRFLTRRVNFHELKDAGSGVRRDFSAFVDPLTEAMSVDSGERVTSSLRENWLALLSGLALLALTVWRVQRGASQLQRAIEKAGARRETVGRRFGTAFVVALSRNAVLAVLNGAGLILQLVLGASAPAWLLALIAILRAFFVWRMTVMFLRVTLDVRAKALRLVIHDDDAAALALRRLERLADWLFAGLFLSTLVGYVGFASPPIMLLFLAMESFAVSAVVRSLRDDRLVTLKITGGLATLARQWRAFLRGMIVISVALAGIGFVNLAWYLLWGLFNSNILALLGILFWRLGVDAVDESIAPTDVRTRSSLKRIVVLSLATLVVVLLPVVWGQWSATLDALGAFASFGVDVGTTKLTVGSVLSAAIWVLSAWVLGRLINAFLTRRVFPLAHADAGVREAVTTTVDYLLIIGGVLLGIRALGFDLTSLAIVAGALSVGVGFGMQTLVSNFVSGLIILYERPFRPGDILEHEGKMGSVRRIRTRSTIVQTVDDAELVLPNAELLSKQITNWTLSNYRSRAVISIGVAYGSDLDLVRETLIEAASSHPRVIEEPQVYFVAFGDSALQFSLMIWVDIREKIQVVSDVLFAVDKAFREKKIDIPFPQRELTVRGKGEG